MYDLSLPPGDKDPICIHLPLFFFFFISDSSCPCTPVGAMLILFWPPGVPQVALIKIGPLVSEHLGGWNFFSLPSSHFMAWWDWGSVTNSGDNDVLLFSRYTLTSIHCRWLFFSNMQVTSTWFFFSFSKLRPRWATGDTAKGQRRVLTQFPQQGSAGQLAERAGWPWQQSFHTVVLTTQWLIITRNEQSPVLKKRKSDFLTFGKTNVTCVWVTTCSVPNKLKSRA